MKLSHFLLGAGLGLSLASGVALAQAAKPAAAPAESPASKAPEVKTIGDWAVRCFPIQRPSP